MATRDLQKRAPVPKAEQARRTRQLIIATGIDCLARYGYAQTSMHLISKEANISRGPLHYHFEDKNDLMGAIAETLPVMASADTMARLRSAASRRERVETLIDIAIEQHLGTHHIVALELLTAARRDEALAAAVLPHFARSEAASDRWWTDYLGQLGADEPTMRALRALFVATMRGLAIDHTTTTDPAHHRQTLDWFRQLFRKALLGEVA